MYAYRMYIGGKSIRWIIALQAVDKPCNGGSVSTGINELSGVISGKYSILSWCKAGLDITFIYNLAMKMVYPNRKDETGQDTKKSRQFDIFSHIGRLAEAKYREKAQQLKASIIIIPGKRPMTGSS
jgi:hypothetical protein